ncbi:F-box/WD repeat-containing protein 9-like [Chelonus insularis]|uniref:F-box/WD repeat-containing protein 9-like n=1 Tax=Chelonus insularis TaxID=460826 RepID=UPI00158D8A21|nr:F-box/WD repeat-containing protein 9-like [Chelonus insularis]
MSEKNDNVNLDDNEENKNESSDEINLTDLPLEIFLYICSFLDASTLVHRLSLVCKQFWYILKEDSMWKRKIHNVWPNSRYPILPPDRDEELFWKLACVAVERQAYLWRNMENIKSFPLEEGHYGCVDGLLLMNEGRLCISGGRDRLLVCWKLDTYVDKQKIQTYTGFGHDGWIRDITSLHGKIYSCSWDQRIHVWSVENTGIEPIHRMALYRDSTSALLCITSNEQTNLIATGSYCKTISVLDPRLSDPLVARYQPHQRAVLKITMNSQYIISGSEDRTVSIWDQRSQRTLESITVSTDSFPMSLCMYRRSVFIGDSGAYIHVLDTDNYKIVKQYKTEHTKGITGIYASLGSIITSSLDSTVRISSPTDPPKQFTILKSPHGDIAGMDYLNDVLAVCGDSALQIWRPKCNTYNIL